MSKIKLTKGELKRQRDSLKQFRHYLPTLQLKKQQLQMKIEEARRRLADKEAQRDKRREKASRWIGLLEDPRLNGVELRPWVVPQGMKLDTVNIAGASIPVLADVYFADQDYDLYTTPFWVDRAVTDLRVLFTTEIEVQVLNREIALLEAELRITTQRVNLFEKVKIPECLDHIRRIRIYLGDMQANAVGISKVAKRKLVEAVF